MENQEINLEKIHRLIGSLQSQATEGSTHGMLSTAQLIVAELQHLHAQNGNGPIKTGNVSVVMPFQGKQIVSHVPLEEHPTPVTSTAPGTSTLQPPTIITEAKPSEAIDNHQFASIPTPPAQADIEIAAPATSPAHELVAAPPHQSGPDADKEIDSDINLPTQEDQKQPQEQLQLEQQQLPQEPVQKELFPLMEEEEGEVVFAANKQQQQQQAALITPLKPSEYPTSIPADSPDIQPAEEPQNVTQGAAQEAAENNGEFGSTTRQAQAPEAELSDEQIKQQSGTHIQPPIEQAPDFDTNGTHHQPVQHLQIDQSEEEKKRHLAFISDNFSTWAEYGLDGEAPTLVQNQPLTKQRDRDTNNTNGDYNNSYQQQHYRELNEQLGQPQEEWAHKMQSTPIENLSSAIGVNDRYLYISELFRGDESMYERSIITLNKFNNFHEAHAWSERELRLKLGWDTKNPITQQFEQLIKRRFMQAS